MANVQPQGAPRQNPPTEDVVDDDHVTLMERAGHRVGKLGELGSPPVREVIVAQMRARMGAKRKR